MYYLSYYNNHHKKMTIAYMRVENDLQIINDEKFEIGCEYDINQIHTSLQSAFGIIKYTEKLTFLKIKING